MTLPERAEAETFILEPEAKNLGGWAEHSHYVAQAARNIAALHPDLDAGDAYIMGPLHDIERQDNLPDRVNVATSTDLRHVLDDYTFLQARGFEDAARIYLSHSFPVQRLTVGQERELDVSEEGWAFLEHYPVETTYDDYDRLLQLLDALALLSGFVLMEKRLLEVALRRGIHETTLEKWRNWLDL